MEVGIDLVEHKDIVNNLEGLAKRILSAKELEIYNTLKLLKRKIEYVASRFAAKEALFKALGEYKHPYSFKDAAILNLENGKPYLKLQNIEGDFTLSLSHTDNYSVAIVIKK